MLRTRSKQKSRVYSVVIMIDVNCSFRERLSRFLDNLCKALLMYS